ncbi:MAG TPA: GNAT family N-acetyltransferase [Pseudonocardiaceae bacterium]|nr:GNAT family N-acetyltransferase [Pseudonocardiaceae bacterium]
MTETKQSSIQTHLQPRGVRAATKADLPELGAVLGRAFFDDPLMSWAFPDESVRRDKLAVLFEVLAKYVHFGHGGTDVAFAGEVLLGAAMWDPPGAWQPSNLVERLVQAGFVRSIGGRGRALGALLKAMDKAQPRQPHWYLAQLGTDPSARGIGLGRSLLDNRLAGCDELGLPAYLESSKESNIAYYERFGFELTGEISAAGSPPVYPMWREPSRQPGA